MAAFLNPGREIEEDSFENGLGFDGSSIRGWQAINESDMLVKPVPETAFIDPFSRQRPLCSSAISATRDRRGLHRDPRTLPESGELSEGLGNADVSFFGPELEFFIFDDIRFDQNEHEATITSIPSKAAGTPVALRIRI